MLTIRFARVGKTNKAQYKIVLQEKSYAPGGRHVEILGSYDPHLKQAVLKEDRIKFWLGKGAQLSDTAHNLFVSKGILTDKKRAVKIKTKKKEEGGEGGEKTEKPAKEGEADKKEEVKTEEKKEETKTEEKKEPVSSADKEEKKIQEVKTEPEETPKEEAKKKE